MTNYNFAYPDEQKRRRAAVTKTASSGRGRIEADTKKGPEGPRNSAVSTKKRGRSIASITVSFAVPFSSGLRGVISRTSLASMPLDPDVKTVFPLMQRPFSHLRPVNVECEDHQEKHALERFENPSSVRAIAQHSETSCCVEDVQTRDKCERGSGSELSNPSASYQPVRSVLPHVCLPVIIEIVTDLRRLRGFTSLAPWAVGAVRCR